MHLYDHIVRVFPFAPGCIGDLRTGKLGVFGALQSRTQLFCRSGAAYSVSNHSHPLSDLAYRRRIQHATVHGYFVKEEPNSAISAADLDRLVIDGLTLQVDPCSEPEAVHHQILPYVYVPSAQRQILNLDSTNALLGNGIVIEPGFEWSVVATMSEPLIMQLNGALWNGDSKWEAGDPSMTRILRVDLEYEQEYGRE